MKTGLESLDTGASKITYSGNEGPKAPQQMAMADPLLVEEYQKYVFDMEEQGLQPMSFEEFRLQAMSGMAEGGRVGLRYGGDTMGGPNDKSNSGRDGRDTGSDYGQFDRAVSRAANNPPSQSQDRDPDPPQDRIQRIASGIEPGYRAQDAQPYGLSKEEAYRQGKITVDQKDADPLIDPKTTTSILDKMKTVPQGTRRRGLKRNIDYILGGRKLDFPLALGIFKGPQEEDEFYAQFAGMSPLEMKAKYNMSDTDIARVQQISQVLNQNKITQSQFEEAFYGPKGPPDLTGGGNGQGIMSQYPTNMAMAPVTGTPEIEPIVTPPVQTANPFLPGSSLPFSTYGTAAHGAQFGVDPRMFAADGGRIGYADGDYVGSKHNVTLKDEYDSYLKEGGTMSFSSFVKMLREDRAQGGRIGYDMGGDVSDRAKQYLEYIKEMKSMGVEPVSVEEFNKMLDAMREKSAQGGRIGAQEGGLMDLGGMEKDYRNEGGFVPIGGQERADDVPARLSKNEFVFTADAVRAAGGGDIDKGAEVMENMMENLEKGGKVSEESQGLKGARDMFATAQRLEGVL